MDTGIINRIIDEKTAEVSINLQDCDSCATKQGCSVFTKGENLIEAEYDGTLKKGDNVSIIFKPQKRLIASFLIFMMPIFMIIASYLLSSIFLKNEKISILISFGSCILYFFFLIPFFKMNKTLSDLKPKIEKID